MRILFITQKINREDSVLGFVHNWLAAFSARFETITAVCLELKNYDLPKNIRVFSLGKEKIGSRFAARIFYAAAFFRIILRERKNYDAVFVHMNPEYVILGWPIWLIFRKKVVIWYNHDSGGLLARLAFLLVDKICHTSPYAFSAGRVKSERMPAGIDTDLFRPISEIDRDKKEIIFLGRISPIKDLETLISAVSLITSQGIQCRLEIFGEAPSRDLLYFDRMRKIAKPLAEKGIVVWRGAVPNYRAPEIWSSAAVNVNLTPRGNYDKTVLEAMACGAISVVSSPAFVEIVPPEFRFREKDFGDLALKLKYVLSLADSNRVDYGLRSREAVIQHESLRMLSDRLVKVFSD